MKLVLIRHGMTRGNLEGRYIGTTDEGLVNSDCLKGAYPKADKLYVSPMKRCIETARIIYPGMKYVICPELRECDFGDFENKSYEELKADPRYIKWLESGGTMPFPNGESHEEFKNRCVEGFNKIIGGLTDETAAFVIHGGTIMAIMQSLFGGSFYDYQIANGKFIKCIV